MIAEKPYESISEEEYQQQVIDLAHVYGWKVAHFRAARVAKSRRNPRGWATPVAADGKGFPDLVLVRDRVIFVEIKGKKARLSNAQADWLVKLRMAKAEVYVWRPDDFEEVHKTLLRKVIS